jgi:hypothetical protein
MEEQQKVSHGAGRGIFFALLSVLATTLANIAINMVFFDRNEVLDSVEIIVNTLLLPGPVIFLAVLLYERAAIRARLKGAHATKLRWYLLILCCAVVFDLWFTVRRGRIII